LDILAMPPDGELLGPVELEEPGQQPEQPGQSEQSGQFTAAADREPRLRALVRAPLAQRKALCAALQAVASSRSAHKEPGAVRIRVDPSDLF
jgi:primosomal protein N' (replication factor Y) (superfamily II helicase)